MKAFEVSLSLSLSLYWISVCFAVKSSPGEFHGSRNVTGSKSEEACQRRRVRGGVSEEACHRRRIREGVSEEACHRRRVRGEYMIIVYIV